MLEAIDPTNNAIRFGSLNKRCVWDKNTKGEDIWLDKDMKENFKKYFEYLKSITIRMKYGFKSSQWIKVERSLFIHMLYDIVKCAVEKKPITFSNVLTNGNEIDCKLVLENEIFETHVKPIILAVLSDTDVISSVMNNIIPCISTRDFISTNEQYIKLQMIISNIVDKYSFANNEEIKEDTEEEKQEENQGQYSTYSTAYQKCIFLLNESNKKPDFYKKFFPLSNITDELCKVVILQMLMLPYRKAYSLKTLAPFIVPSNLTTFEDWVSKDFNLTKWCGEEDTNSLYYVTVQKKLDEIMHIIKDGNLEVINGFISDLSNKIGYWYSLHDLCLTGSNEIYKKLKVFKKNIVMNIFADIFKDREYTYTKGNLVYEINRHNPYVVKNCITFTTNSSNQKLESLIVDLNLNTLCFFGERAFDIQFLIVMIVENKGKNEYMGFPDNPGVSKIWTKLTDVTHTLKSIMNFCLKGAEKLEETIMYVKNCLTQISDYPTDMDGFSNEAEKLFVEMEIDSETHELFMKTFKDNINKNFICFQAVVYFLIYYKKETFKKYDVFVKDINLLHLIGYLGWILISEVTIDHTSREEREDCLHLFNRYILRLDNLRKPEDIDYDQYFYYSEKPNIYSEYFDKKMMIKQLMSFPELNKSYSTIEEQGFGFIQFYLKTIASLRIGYLEGYIVNAPFYMNDKSLLPLPIFKYTFDFDYDTYIFAAKVTDDEDALSRSDNEFSTFNYTYKNNHVYQICICNLQVCSYHNSQINIPRIYNEDISLYELNVVDHYTCMDTVPLNSLVRLHFSTKTNNENIISMLYSTDMYMQDRKEHFRVFTKYVIDFSNMISEYYLKGIINRNGQLDMTTEDKPYNYSSNTEYNPNELNTNMDSIKDYLYEMYFNRFMDEEEVQEEFQNNFKYYMNANANIGRDYDKDLNKTSKLVFFHKTIATSPEIFSKKIFTNEEMLFGMKERSKYNNRFVADILTSQLGKTISFNEMIIKKSMISKILMKFLERDIINPFYQFSNDEGDDIVKRMQHNAVSRHFHYINFDSFQTYPNDSNEILTAKYAKGLIYYCIFWTYLVTIIEPTEEFYKDRQPVLNVDYVLDVEKIHMLINHKLPRIELMIKPQSMRNTILDTMFILLSKYFNPSSNLTYKYHFVNMQTLQDIILVINEYMSYSPNFDSLQKIVAGNDIDEILKEETDENVISVIKKMKHICDLYTEAEEKLFPDIEDKTIHHKGKFMSELIDITLKYMRIRNETDVFYTLPSLYNPINNAFEEFSIDGVNDPSITDIVSKIFEKMTSLQIPYLGCISDWITEMNNKVSNNERVKYLIYTILKIPDYVYNNYNIFNDIHAQYSIIHICYWAMLNSEMLSQDYENSA